MTDRMRSLDSLLGDPSGAARVSRDEAVFLLTRLASLHVALLRIAAPRRICNAVSPSARASTAHARRAGAPELRRHGSSHALAARQRIGVVRELVPAVGV